jgi:hypothetical protein
MLQVGAGILAIPAVTQESGFLASTVTCIFCWAFMVIIIAYYVFFYQIQLYLIPQFCYIEYTLFPLLKNEHI